MTWQTSSSSAKSPPDGKTDYNRLINESSPYLLQHATNPVNWYPWNEEAFAVVKREDKPIFLSIGYSTCHWCHVRMPTAKALRANSTCGQAGCNGYYRCCTVFTVNGCKKRTGHGLCLPRICLQTATTSIDQMLKNLRQN